MDSAREQAMADSLAGLRTDMATLSAEVRYMLQRVDPMLLDHEQRIRDLEKRPEVGDLGDRVRELEQIPGLAELPGRVRDVERWQWRRELPVALGSGGIAAVATSIIAAMTGG